jgi:uncharacterized protein YndB with AHSA1/START domain
MTTISNVGKSVWTTPSDREIVTTRVFDAPRRLVFAAFTEPEHVQHWLLGPDGWTMPVCEIDLRVGGEWRYVYRNPGDGREFEMHGIYREIIRPERVVNTERFQDGESLNTLELTEYDGRTTMVQTMLMASKEDRDGALATGMTGGVDISYRRLDNYLQTIAE